MQTNRGIYEGLVAHFERGNKDMKLTEEKRDVMHKPYFHKITNEEYQRLIDDKWTLGKVAEHYKQPSWCGYPNALEGQMGCWSLLSMERHQISPDFCRNCDCFME